MVVSFKFLLGAIVDDTIVSSEASILFSISMSYSYPSNVLPSLDVIFSVALQSIGYLIASKVPRGAGYAGGARNLATHLYSHHSDLSPARARFSANSSSSRQRQTQLYTARVFRCIFSIDSNVFFDSPKILRGCFFFFFFLSSSLSESYHFSGRVHISAKPLFALCDFAAFINAKYIPPCEWRFSSLNDSFYDWARAKSESKRASLPGTCMSVSS